MLRGSSAHSINDRPSMSYIYFFIPGYDVRWEEETSTVSASHTLHYAPPGEKSGEALQVTGLAWNCTGAVIAAAYGMCTADLVHLMNSR